MQMKREVHGDEAWDSLPGDSPFANGPQGAGLVDKQVARHPQREFTEWIENERARATPHAFEVKTCAKGVRLSRDEEAYLSCNVGSSLFVGLPSTPVTRMDNVTFRECWSHYLGGPSPVCAPHVGHRFIFVKRKRTSFVDTE